MRSRFRPTKAHRMKASSAPSGYDFAPKAPAGTWMTQNDNWITRQVHPRTLSDTFWHFEPRHFCIFRRLLTHLDATADLGNISKAWKSLQRYWISFQHWLISKALNSKQQKAIAEGSAPKASKSLQVTLQAETWTREWKSMSLQSLSKLVYVCQPQGTAQHSPKALPEGMPITSPIPDASDQS